MTCDMSYPLVLAGHYTLNRRVHSYLQCSVLHYGRVQYSTLQMDVNFHVQSWPQVAGRD